MSDMVFLAIALQKFQIEEKPFNWYFWEGFYKESNIKYNLRNTELYNT